MTRLPNIQVLRAVAAMMIVVHHCGIETSRLAASFGQDRLFNDAPWGAGVPLFFAISGFIMVATTGNEFGSFANAWNFMRRRLIRIVPLYWLITTGALVAAMIVPSLMKLPPGDNWYFLASYGFWPYVRADLNVRPLVTPGWTLNLEMFFYVIFAIGLCFPKKFGLAFLFTALTSFVALRLTGVLPGVALNFWGDPIVLGFVLGALVGLLYNRGHRLGFGSAGALLAVGAAALLGHGDFAGLKEDDFVPRIADAIPSAVIVAAIAMGPQLRESAKDWWPALFIGDASYSLYLIHEFVLRPLYLVWLKSVGTSLSLWLFLPIGISASVVVAAALYLFFEKPVTRWLSVATKRPAGSPMRLVETPA